MVRTGSALPTLERVKKASVHQTQVKRAMVILFEFTMRPDSRGPVPSRATSTIRLSDLPYYAAYLQKNAIQK
jgi:hypothetical protein